MCIFYGCGCFRFKNWYLFLKYTFCQRQKFQSLEAKYLFQECFPLKKKKKIVGMLGKLEESGINFRLNFFQCYKKRKYLIEKHLHWYFIFILKYYFTMVKIIFCKKMFSVFHFFFYFKDWGSSYLLWNQHTCLYWNLLIKMYNFHKYLKIQIVLWSRTAWETLVYIYILKCFVITKVLIYMYAGRFKIM